MRNIINPKLWKPKGVKKLETNAEKAIKIINKNIFIIAGPGAGKTELLAQKACYLLETNLCKSPKRILAISFKKDAAKNLKDRVELRIGKELGKRFDSFTFDAFSNSLLSRFRNGLPETLKPTKDYEIDLKAKDKNLMQDLYFNFQTEDELTNWDSLSRILTVQEANLLYNKIYNSNPSQLSFGMIGRLTELIFKINPSILKALRQTYSYVFLDEFQDTTKIQYDLLNTCFKESEIKLTAVGDTKQGIMGWAGALENIFNVFEQDFKSEKIHLDNNYRSAPNLVRIQHTIIKELEGEEASLPIASNLNYSDKDGICKFYKYSTEEIEAIHLADIISNLIKNENIKPRDICILTRNNPENYTQLIIKSLNSKNINIRIENEFQDLLSEPLTILILNLLKLMTSQRNANAWQEVLTYLLNSEISFDNTHKKSIEIETTLENFIKESKIILKTNLQLDALLREVIKLLNLNNLKSTFPQYKRDEYLNDILNKLYAKLSEYVEKVDLKEAIKKFEGEDSIPIMTMHKSKGLEFHTIFFIGLEDSSLWGYQRNPIEETNGFFVAFSRAKEQIYFTYAQNRNTANTRFNSWKATFDNSKIDKLYSLLSDAGIYFEEIVYEAIIEQQDDKMASEEQTCPHCKGDKKYHDKLCTICDGKGSIPSDLYEIKELEAWSIKKFS